MDIAGTLEYILQSFGDESACGETRADDAELAIAFPL